MIELDVKLRGPLRLQDLRDRVPAELAALLRLQAATLPPVVSEEMHDGVRIPVTEDREIAGDADFLLSLAGTDDEVWVLTTDLTGKVAPEWEDGVEGGMWSGVSLVARTPLAWALGAATALVLARMAGTWIRDEVSYWTKCRELTPDRFAEVLRLDAPASDLHEAADQFKSRLPRKV